MDIDIIILVVIAFILGFISSKFYYKNKIKEHLVNLDDSRKVALTKCCDDEKCYSKPPYLRADCIKNKTESLKKLETQFEQMYTQDEYYDKVNNKLGFITNSTNFERDINLLNKLNEKLNVNNRLDQATFDNIINDTRDEVPGSDTIINNYASK